MEKFSVKKPFTILVAVIMVLLLGFVSITNLQTNLLPDISTPYLMVVTVYPGASPERVESEVSDVMENALGTVSGVESITATSAENYSLLLMKFAEGTDMNSAMVKTSNKVDQTATSLPSTCLTPSIIEYSLNMNAFMTVAVSREGSDVYDLSDFVDNTLVPYVGRTGGVSSVSANGLIEKMVQVQLNQDKIDEVNARLLELIDTQLADARAQLEAKRNQTEKQAQEKNQSILQLERETARLEQKKATSELEEKQIVDRLWDSYELTPGTAEKEIVEIENLAAANKRIGEVRRKISALGTPNLGAIDEYARVSERYEYLTAQRDDVQHAKSELETIVASITTEMTEIFVREFARIDEYFGKTFAEMFGGGKGELKLADPDDILNSGIDMYVQPPGKVILNLEALSGGEKALAAIALLFAILKVTPSPFCVLDEIEAALDDVNVDRYAAYLRRMCDKTQFIAITHRRGTMEEADTLYGVTMQERGVSKLLELRASEVEEKLGLKLNQPQG